MILEVRLDVELDVHHVAVFHDVVFAFQLKLTGLLDRVHVTHLDQQVCRDDLGADKATLQVRVYLTRRRR